MVWGTCGERARRAVSGWLRFWGASPAAHHLWCASQGGRDVNVRHTSFQMKKQIASSLQKGFYVY